MQTKYKRWGVVLLAMVMLLGAGLEAGTQATKVVYTAEAASVTPRPRMPADPLLLHRQNVWIGALEWCESAGRPSAINENDLDGTPSYGAFQFKPDTMLGFGVKYGIWNAKMASGSNREFFMDNLLMDDDLQREIVGYMINDPQVKLESQFPGCLKKIGRPPVK